MRARVGVYDRQTAKIFQGYLPVTGLKFSEEVGSGGTCTFEALGSDLDALSAWDAVLKIQIERASGVWINGPAYVTRHEYAHKGGTRRWSFTCKSLLEAWASETILLPEYVVNTMPKRCGVERGVGWMMSAYGPIHDPYEPWDRCYETSRTTMPPDWPSGTGAEWISATGATKETESKYFRGGLSITGTANRLVEFWLSSDETATLWVAGERIIATSSVETGYKDKPATAKMRLYPGNYAVGIHTVTDFTKGGDGVDPVLAAAAILNSDGDPSTWIMHTSNETFVACRRDDEPPNDVPPGPNPGQVLTYLINEAKERNAAGWQSVTYGFTVTNDSYGHPWANQDVVERIFRYGQDSYWSMFQAWGESGEVDVWMGADLVLHAAPRQGEHQSITFSKTHFHSLATSGTEGYGNWVIAQGHGGWIYTGATGTGAPRREFALEIGEAYSRPIATKIAKAALQDRWRWDAAGSMNPPQSGWVPYYDFFLGDDMHVSYQAIEHNVSVTSLSATAGEGGLLWDVEFTEYPPEAVIPPSGGEIDNPSSGALMATATAVTAEESSATPATATEPEPAPPTPTTLPSTPLTRSDSFYAEPGLFQDLESYVPAPPPTAP